MSVLDASTPCTGRGGQSERGARSRDKEAAMQRLREMGYF